MALCHGEECRAGARRLGLFPASLGPVSMSFHPYIARIFERLLRVNRDEEPI